MSVLGFKVMYILVMFDLPVTEDEEKKAASNFRKFLISDGYIMMQYSVYIRPILGEERYEKHMQRIKTHLPPSGVVNCIRITDIQFKKMSVLVSSELRHRKKRKNPDSDQLTFW